MNRARQVELPVIGMHCINCAQSVEGRLKRMGLGDVSVDLASNLARFSLEREELLPEIASQIEKLGYRTSLPKDQRLLARLFSSLNFKFWFCLVFTLPLLGHMILPFQILHDPKLQLVLCLPVYIVGCQHFGRSAFNSLRQGHGNMDVLIFLGSTAAFFYSLSGTLLELGPDYLFYETSATIITVVLLGNMLEHLSASKTGSAIEELARIQPTRARKVIGQNGSQRLEDVSISDLELGDLVQVNSGDKIPTDGIVEWGGGSINESIVTGESMPVEREIGGRLIGGTLLMTGTLRMRVTGLGQDTVLASIIRLVKQAQAHKPQIHRIADRISNVFVPAVVVVALLTLLGNYLWFDQDFQASLLRSIAVLVIACPCAMGLATPAAVMVGIGQAARNGVLFRGGDSVEKLAGVRAMVFDKTGTLTTGMFKVKEIKTFGPPEDFVKSVLLGLEHHSSHPIAQSIVREFAGIQPHPFRSHDEIKGLGVRARDERGSEFQAGSYASLNDTSVEPGHSLYLSENGKVIAWVDLEDEPREGTEDLIASLRSFGIKSVVLSGDARTKTEALAKRIGIEEVHAEKLPQQKMEILKGLEQENPCAYVGDGINDAPALAQARVGIALSQASESAIQSSQVVLFGGALTKLLSAVVIARRTVAIIKQNLFWAFFYNVLAIPLAAAGFLNPMIGALAMAFSDIIVIANSLRLRSSRALHL